MAKDTQSWLNARASIALDLYREGRISEAEKDRVQRDARLGCNTGTLKFLPESEQTRAKKRQKPM